MSLLHKIHEESTSTESSDHLTVVNSLNEGSSSFFEGKFKSLKNDVSKLLRLIEQNNETVKILERKFKFKKQIKRGNFENNLELKLKELKSKLKVKLNQKNNGFEEKSYFSPKVQNYLKQRQLKDESLNKITQREERVIKNNYRSFSPKRAPILKQMTFLKKCRIKNLNHHQNTNNFFTRKKNRRLKSHNNSFDVSFSDKINKKYISENYGLFSRRTINHPYSGISPLRKNPLKL